MRNYHTTRWGLTYIDCFLERYECDPDGRGKIKVREEPVFANQDREKPLVHFDELWGVSGAREWEDRAIYHHERVYDEVGIQPIEGNLFLQTEPRSEPTNLC